MSARWKSDEGFTLIELLVVILIIGILAAIALPSFLAQRGKSQDSAAKSNARNLMTQVEGCYIEHGTYTPCDTATMTTTGLPIGDTAGLVEAEATGGGDGYLVTAHSMSGYEFSISRADIGSDRVRICDIDAQGCHEADAHGNMW